MFSLYSDGCETRPTLTDSFRLERGGQFVSGFQGSRLYSYDKKQKVVLRMG
jgi:hypothetical protein